MGTTRRDFLKTSAALAGALAAGACARTAASADGAGAAPRPLRILILGGTGQTGPFQVRHAVERGHHVTVFNRGRRQAELPASVVHLTGDRNTRGLDALKGTETWDVVIDNPTTLPHWVRDVGEILKDRAGHFVFISTQSVYASRARPGTDETAALSTYEGDPLAVTAEAYRQAGARLYGPLKAASEAEAERWFPGKTTIIRPGLIVGPRDETGRFTYWPVRIAEGGEVLAPGTPDDPVQWIDGRDLAEWTIRLAERRATGAFNAIGPREPTTIGRMLEGIRQAVGSACTERSECDARFTFVQQDFLAARNVRGWTDMPVWVMQTPENLGYSRMSNARAVAAGLTFRPLAETARDTLAWYRAQPAEQQARLRGPFTREREREVLAAWRGRAPD